MLEIRPTCENCNVSLPNTSNDAMICTFECTFCKDCVDTVLENVCPNCGGGFEKRPIRPSGYLDKYPISSKVMHKPVQQSVFKDILQKFKSIKPNNR